LYGIIRSSSMGMISACYSTPYETAAKVQNNSEIQNTNGGKKFAKDVSHTGYLHLWQNIINC